MSGQAIQDLLDELQQATGIDFFSELGSLFSGLDSSAIALIVSVTIIASILILLVALATYIAQAWGLYQMAKKVGHRKAWLAWIPYARYWLMFNMPTNNFKPLAFKKEFSNRTVVFWIYIAITVGGSYILSLISVIPYIGPVIASIGRLAILVANVFMLYPMYKDMYLMYYEDSNAQGYTLASMIGHFLAPILPALLMVFTSGKTPREYVSEQ